MSKDRKSIYLRPPVHDVLRGRRDDLSTVINQVAERYHCIVSECKVDLTEQHWTMLSDTFKVYRGPLDMTGVRGFPAVAKAHLRLYHAGESAEDLVEMLDNMSLPYLVALIDTLERTER